MTTPDLFLVIGLVLCGLSLPSIIGAFSAGRAPRAAAIVLLIGGGLIIIAVNLRPYTINEIPAAFARVVSYLLP